MPDETSLPDDIEELMKAFGVPPAGTPAKPTESSPPPPSSPTSSSAAPAAPVPPAPSEPVRSGASAAAAVHRPQLESFPSVEGARGEASLDLLKDVALHVRIEVGRTRMYIQDILRLGPGSVVELDRLTGDALDLYVNDRLVARGEVLVINEMFAIRITEVLHSRTPEEKPA